MLSTNDQRWYLVIWNLINLVLFLYVISHTSTAPNVLGRYTTSYALGIGLAAVLALSVLVFARFGTVRRWLSVHVFDRLPMLVVIGAAAFNLLMWLLPGDAEQIKLFVGVNTFLLGLWLCGQPSGITNLTRWRPLLYALTVVLIAVSFFSAYSIPALEPRGDEAIWTNIATTWIETGGIYPSLNLIDPIPILPGVGYWVIGLASWLSLFGVEFAALRLMVWVVTILVIIAVALMAGRLYDRDTGLIAAVITAAGMYLLNHRVMRPELGLIALVSLLMVVYLKRKHSLWAFACGILCVLTLEIHASGIAYIVGIGAAFLWETIAAARKGEPFFVRSLIPFVLGGALASAVYVVLHLLVLPDPGYFFEHLRSGREFLTLDNLSAQWLEILDRYWQAAPLELIVFGFALIVLIVRRSETDRLILRLFLLTLASLLILVPFPQDYSEILLPFIFVIMAAAIRFGWQMSSEMPRAPGLAAGLMLGAVVVPFVGTSLPHMNLTNPYPRYQASDGDQCLRAFTAPEAAIVSDYAQYWAFAEAGHGRFVGIVTEYELQKFQVLPSPISPWDQLDPEVVAYTETPGFPELAPRLAAYLEAYEYEEVIRFVDTEFVTRVWLRPGYEPPSGREQVVAFCESIVTRTDS